MPQSIPPGLTRNHILRALADLDGEIDHPFGAPTGYELVHADKRYAPNRHFRRVGLRSFARITLPPGSLPTRDHACVSASGKTAFDGS